MNYYTVNRSIIIQLVGTGLSMTGVDVIVTDNSRKICLWDEDGKSIINFCENGKIELFDTTRKSAISFLIFMQRLMKSHYNGSTHIVNSTAVTFTMGMDTDAKNILVVTKDLNIEWSGEYSEEAIKFFEYVATFKKLDIMQ